MLTSIQKYGLEVYGHTSKANIKKIQTLQNKILKTIFNKDQLTPTITLHKELHILQVQFSQANLLLVCKQRNNLLPEIFKDYFKVRNEIHDINVRNSNKLHVIKTKTNQGNKMFKTKGASLYNSLPDEFLNIKTISNFKKRVKQFFISKY